MRPDKFFAELTKCQLLCVPCHMEKTRKELISNTGTPNKIGMICLNGHQLIGDNIKTLKNGRIRCRECARDSQRKYKANLKRLNQP